jgi:hypothetical protein
MKRPTAEHPFGEVLLGGALLLVLLVKVPGFSLFPASVVIAALFLPAIAKSFRATRLVAAVTALAGLAMVSGFVLSLVLPREAGTAGGPDAAFPVVMWLCCIPLIIALGVWAMERVGVQKGLVLLFLGALASTLVNAGTISWKGSIGFYATLLVLSMFSQAPLFFTRAALAGAAVLSTMFDARSMAIIIGLTFAATFVSRRALTWATRRPLRALVVISAVGSAASFLAILAMQSGLLGAAVQLRTLDQMRKGSLLTGARAEWAATFELFKNHPYGFGTAVRVEPGLQSDAVSAVRAAGGDAGASYFRTMVFGERTDLHSQTADLWFHFGIPGAIVAVLMLLILISAAPHLIGQLRTFGAAPVMVALVALWDICFSPMADLDRTLAGLIVAVVVTVASRRSVSSEANSQTLWPMPTADRPRTPAYEPT